MVREQAERGQELAQDGLPLIVVWPKKKKSNVGQSQQPSGSVKRTFGEKYGMNLGKNMDFRMVTCCKPLAALAAGS